MQSLKKDNMTSFPMMNLGANLHLTLKLEMLRVKVKDKGCSVSHSSSLACILSVKMLS